MPSLESGRHIRSILTYRRMAGNCLQTSPSIAAPTSSGQPDPAAPALGVGERTIAALTIR